jgi:rubrerythrin
MGIDLEMVAQYESELWDHFVGEHSRAYFANGALRTEGTVVCDFCDVRTNAHTFSGAEVTSSCPSCGHSWKVNTATGETEELPDRARFHLTRI